MRCYVKNCPTDWENGDERRSFCFPDDDELREIWLKNIRILNKQKTPMVTESSNVRICCLHFSIHSYDRLQNSVRLKNNAIPTIFPRTNDCCMIDYTTKIPLVIANPNKKEVTKGPNFRMMNLNSVGAKVNTQNICIKKQDVPANKTVIIASKLAANKRKNHSNVMPISSVSIKQVSRPSSSLSVPAIQKLTTIRNPYTEQDASEVLPKQQKISFTSASISTEFHENEMVNDHLDVDILDEQSMNNLSVFAEKSIDFIHMDAVTPSKSNFTQSAVGKDPIEIPIPANILHKKADNEYPNSTVCKDLRSNIVNPNHIAETMEKEDNPNVIFGHSKKPPLNESKKTEKPKHFQKICLSFPETNDNNMIDYTTKIPLVISNSNKEEVATGPNFRVINLNTVGAKINAQNMYMKKQDVPTNKKVIIASKLTANKPKNHPNVIPVSSVSIKQVSRSSSSPSVPAIQKLTTIRNPYPDEQDEVPPKKQKISFTSTLISTEFHEKEMINDPLDADILDKQRINNLSGFAENSIDLTSINEQCAEMEELIHCKPNITKLALCEDPIEIQTTANIVKKKAYNRYPNSTVCKDLRSDIMLSKNGTVINSNHIEETMEKEDNSNVILGHNKKPPLDESEKTEKPKHYQKICFSFRPHIEEEVNRTIKDPMARRCIKILKQSIENKNEKLSVLPSQIEVINKRIEHLRQEKIQLEKSSELNDPRKNRILHEIIRGPVNGKFTKSVRTFSTFLHCYSPQAYKFVRRTFLGKLPNPNELDKITMPSKKVKKKEEKKIINVNPLNESQSE